MLKPSSLFFFFLGLLSSLAELESAAESSEADLSASESAAEAFLSPFFALVVSSAGTLSLPQPTRVAAAMKEIDRARSVDECIPILYRRWARASSFLDAVARFGGRGGPTSSAQWRNLCWTQTSCRPPKQLVRPSCRSPRTQCSNYRRRPDASWVRFLSDLEAPSTPSVWRRAHRLGRHCRPRLPRHCARQRQMRQS